MFKLDREVLGYALNRGEAIERNRINSKKFLVLE